MSARTVSCVIPVYNGERFLAEGIESLLAQTRPPDEIIVVDDGSTDGTAGVARGFGDHVTYVHQENAGPAAARNRGVREARGEFISFLDADDLWEPTKLERQLRRFEARPELGYSVGLVQNFWEEEVAEERDRIAGTARAKPIPGYVTLTLLTTSSWMRELGGFDESLGHGDAADWFRRADAAGAVGELLDEVVARRRLHRDNRSRTNSGDSRDEFLAMLKRKLDRERASAGGKPDTAPAPSRDSAPGGAAPQGRPQHPIEFPRPAVAGLVSCIVAVHDGERFVAEAIESILAQTHEAIEVIVIDDGSTDDTPGILDGFGERIRTFRQDNRGPAAARNLGLRESRGEFIAFLDADDVWVTDKIEAQLSVLRADGDVDLCSGHIRSFWTPELDDERQRLEDDPYHREKPMLSPCTLLTTRSTFERIGGFDPQLRTAEDSDWFIRFQRAGLRFSTLPRLVTHRRQHADNLTRRTPPSRDGLLGLIQRSVEPEEST